MTTFDTLREKLPRLRDRSGWSSHPGLLLTRYLDSTVSVPVKMPDLAAHGAHR